ncbi:hypothetical protein B0T21DRAFT_390835, partial [Apiosordaria backusii]
MLEKSINDLFEDHLDSTNPPPPYVHDNGPVVDDSEKPKSSSLQSSHPTETKSEDTTSQKGGIGIWRRALSRISPSNSHATGNTKWWGKRLQEKLTAAYHGPPTWRRHNDISCMSTKLPRPFPPATHIHRYSIDVLCCPPPQPFASETARWQQARLYVSANDLSQLQKPIPWRANIEDRCCLDNVQLINYAYPVPFLVDRPSGKVKAYDSIPTGTGVSVGGPIYERTIQLIREHGRRPGWPKWGFSFTMTSRDGAWLCSLSRTDVARLIDLDSVIRIVGWIHPDPKLLGTSVLFYRKTISKPWLEVVNLEETDHIPSSFMGEVHDREMR